MTTEPDSLLDVDALLDACGGNTAARAAYLARGFEPPSAQVVRKWRERKSIPGEHLAVLLLLLELHNGKPLSIIPFIRKRPPCLSKNKHMPSGERAGVFD